MRKRISSRELALDRKGKKDEGSRIGRDPLGEQAPKKEGEVF